MVILRDPQSGETLQATLPQTGDFLGLGKGDAVFVSWDQAQARCFAAEGA
jgi:spermidine/putrescine transport system ATP-binding protein